MVRLVNVGNDVPKQISVSTCRCRSPNAIGSLPPRRTQVADGARGPGSASKFSSWRGSFSWWLRNPRYRRDVLFLHYIVKRLNIIDEYPRDWKSSPLGADAQ